MNSIKNELEMQKYDVTILARANSFGNPNDSLDQYIAMLKHLPLDVIKIVEWIGILPTDGTIKYLDMDYHMNIIRNQEKNKEPYDECNKVKDSIYKNNNNNNILKNPVTLEYQQTNLSERNKIYNEKNNNNNNTKTIIEEDDLESVVSETNSLHHDYDFIHDKNSYDSATAKKRFSFLNDENNKEVISSINSISINDKQTILMYAPQFDIHSKQLSSAIETFLTVIENNLPPMEFVQQGKIIILEAHKLVYIGDSISKNLIDIVLKDEMRNMADKLCEVLKICVQNMKIAADEVCF
uniref:CAS_C domain-containing protein n=1 Tax=Parastrongyloides trichosuri TaxID=131310 RepID=A0A0N4ZH31_PARTI